MADLIEVLKEMACFRNRIVVVMKARNENERVGEWCLNEKSVKSMNKYENDISGMHIHHAVEPVKSELRRGLIERFLIRLFKIFK